MGGRLPQIFLNVSHHKQLNTFPIITFFYGKYIFGTTLPGWLCHIVAIVQYFCGMMGGKCLCEEIVANHSPTFSYWFPVINR
jgi:hypothetical protein